MCGRYTLATPIAELVDHFNVVDFPTTGPRYNVAPSQNLPTIRLDLDGKREAVAMRWGLIPSWAKDATVGYKMINARAETVAEKPAYRSAFKSRRCLVPTDGFFEWLAEGKVKTPRWFSLADHSPFAFAGLWERWAGDGEPVESYTVITTTPNELVSLVHDRMPVILHDEDYDGWLDPKASPKALESMLVPFPAVMMTARVVGRQVGSPRYDKPDCINSA